jgi:hypothetical protein
MRTLGITILLTLTALLIACSGYFTASDNANSNQANSANAVVAENTNIDANANIDLANANANIVNVPAKRPTLTPKPEPLTRDAPDDSVITAENDTDGDLVETRIFKNHEMLAKVERVLTASRREGTIRVFLKNGRVYEFPVGRLKNVLSESPETIIRSVGSEALATGATGTQASNKAPAEPKPGSGTVKADPAPTPLKH